MPAVTVRVRTIELFERAVVLRLPFRFGAATVTACPQAFVRIEAEVDHKRVVGGTAELMVPKWFDKSPGLTHEQNFEQLRDSLRCARDTYLGAALSPYKLSEKCGGAAIAAAVAQGLPRLVAQFGAAQLDKAVADAALRAAGRDWVSAVGGGLLGDPFSAQLELARPDSIQLRHTVGLADRLTDADAGHDPQDGLPATLEAAIARYGLRWFKLKLSGSADADLDRLQRIAAVLETSNQAHAGDWRVTLDGNETFDSAETLEPFWRALTRAPALRTLLARTVLLEQPLNRKVALSESIDRLQIGVPVIIDESDDQPQALDVAVALGYRGVSSKACKGIYRSLRSALQVRQRPGLVLSGEDLTCQAGLAMQQDTLLAASLGVTHIERNGHHYVDGFGVAPEREAASFLQAHRGLYGQDHGSEDNHGRVRLAVRDGALDIRSLHVAGFANAAAPQWGSLQPFR